MIVVPAPGYTREDGHENIASHFPMNANEPDFGKFFLRGLLSSCLQYCFLGPKIYVATRDIHETGSTVLHKDVSDAVNILAYAEQRPGDVDFDAKWLLFLEKDSSILREFLREVDQRRRTANGDNKLRSPTWDPIHAHEFHISDDMLSELRCRGVVPFIIHQRYGEAVFIPPGCAHQVRWLILCPALPLTCASG